MNWEHFLENSVPPIPPGDVTSILMLQVPGDSDSDPTWSCFQLQPCSIHDPCYTNTSVGTLCCLILAVSLPPTHQESMHSNAWILPGFSNICWRFFFFFFLTGQYRCDVVGGEGKCGKWVGSEWEREMGGTGKVHEAGFYLGIPEVCHMSVQLPTRLSAPTSQHLLFNLLCPGRTFLSANMV